MASDPSRPRPRDSTDLPTLRGVIVSATRTLRAAGIGTPERDARLLAAAVLGGTSLDFLMQPDRRLSPDEAQRMAALVHRRLDREPVSRILGQRAFFGRDFTITPATLDPRPDTETLIEWVLDIASERGWRTRPIRIVDIGTGSGCILLTLLAELPLAAGLGTDIDAAAIAVARINAARLGVAGRAAFTLTRSLAGLGGTFDLLVANPPYIPSGEIAALDPEVRVYDPHDALDGGLDGLDVFREIAAGLPRIVPEGVAVFEAGAGQAEMVVDILDPGHDRVTQTRRDLGGHVRCVAMWTHS